MKKIFFPSPYEVEVESCHFPKKEELAESEVLIQTGYSLISPGTELALYTGTHNGIQDVNNKWAKFPFYPGYAAVGTVLAAGNSVEEIRPGDKVYTLGYHSSHQVLDVNNRQWPVIKLPDGMDLKDAVFTRLTAISMTSIVQSNIQVGNTAIILGLGLIGNLAGQLYSLLGAKVIGVDTVRERVEIALRSGFHQAFKPSDEPLQNQIMQLTCGRAPDIVVEATGSPSLVTPSLAIVKALGQVIALGSTRGEVKLDVYEWIHKKGIRYTGAHEGLQRQEGFPSRYELTEYCINQIYKKAISVDPLLTHIVPYTEAKQAYEMLLNHKETALGVLLDWTDLNK